MRRWSGALGGWLEWVDGAGWALRSTGGDRVGVHGRVVRAVCRRVESTRLALLWRRGFEDLLRAFQRVFWHRVVE